MDFDFGPVVRNDGTLFRIWAPLHKSILLKLEDGPEYEMRAVGDGWFERRAAEAKPGSLYRFQLPDGLEIPDPASRFQPRDVHGPSEVIDLNAYRWKTTGWKGRPFEEMVIYELHPGAFTEQGGFLSIIQKLEHLQQLGVTAIQLMPISDFPGRYNWGYDGVLPYAPESSYGRPEHLMALVDEAHARGICVFLDVVYNHFGSDGNYMPSYAPIFTDNHHTPWGAGVNYDGEGSRHVREFIIQNAIYWVSAYQLDGLRLDAVHAVQDDSEEHLLHELARRVREAAGDRHVHLIVENEDNDSDLIGRAEDGSPEFYTAQWNDDIHHVLHIAATGETFGYYQDYADDKENLGWALAEGFVFQGEHMPYRGDERGKPSRHLPPTSFISFIQNHDQIGNRAMGDRMSTYRPEQPLKAIAAIYLLAPQIPMLFMGEEWGAEEPFPFFCELNEDLNDKVRKGRREELSRLPGFDGDDLPDPIAYETFASAKLDWSKAELPSSLDMLSFYRSLIETRHRHIVPLLKGVEAGRFEMIGAAVTVTWKTADDKELRLLANLTDEVVTISGLQETEHIFAYGSLVAGQLQPWTVIWSLV
ncbi:malto-oligosyltrehalose trehalohydrolase [Agrobacterium larrymoorei]|nr:malto-oligosyltrehalose trehalohydrolase [Agrobacterium larrymoorei]NTJ41904.1 malto-oligosyltrehalose trehalohydrolase [Agrobacterium larrymoorei]